MVTRIVAAASIAKMVERISWRDVGSSARVGMSVLYMVSSMGQEAKKPVS
jgi:hypothetical protein